MRDHSGHTYSEARRGLWIHFLAYLACGVLMTFIWSSTGAVFFWPAIPLLIWGAGLGGHVHLVREHRALMIAQPTPTP
jgi:hypothetical protein